MWEGLGWPVDHGRNGTMPKHGKRYRDSAAKIEQGKRTPSLGVIEDLARAMGRDPLEMFRRPRP